MKLRFLYVIPAGCVVMHSCKNNVDDHAMMSDVFNMISSTTRGRVAVCVQEPIWEDLWEQVTHPLQLEHWPFEE